MPSGERSSESENKGEPTPDGAQDSLPRASRAAASTPQASGANLTEPAARSVAAQASGRRLGQYTLLEKIGQGGMGSVFKSFDTALERTVALKVLFSSALDSPKQSERFLREARSLARLNHPNLVHVYNVGLDDDCYYFAMELLEGESLAQMIRRRRRIPVNEALPVIGQILSALHYVHKQGITHRDIKSGNVMVCNRRAVLMDFGLAKDDHYSGLTSDGSVLGTPDYMAPEQAEGIVAGPPTDLYSFGIVMYEMLSGAVPFTGRSALTIIRQHMEIPPPPIEAALPNIDPLLASCIHKCLSKKPTDRYANCGALAADLVKLMATPDLQALAEDAQGDVPKTLPRPMSAMTAAATDRTQMDVMTAPMMTVASAPVAQSATMTMGARAVRVNESSILTVPETEAIETVPHRERTQRPFLWMAVGFFGVIGLAIFLAKSGGERHNSPQEPTGTPVRLHRPNEKTEDIRLVEFRTEGKDPSQWIFVYERLTPDGKWVQETTTYKNAQSEKALIEFLPK